MKILEIQSSPRDEIYDSITLTKSFIKASKDGALRAIALGVCDYLAETAGYPGQLAKMPLEGSIIPVVEGMLQEGAAKHAIAPGTDPKLLATTAAWAIFGAARLWHQTPDRVPAEEMAAKIEAIVKLIFLTDSM